MKKITILPLLVLLFTLTAFAQQSGTKHALLKSIVLPGWGEYSYESPSAYIFFGSELALWLGFGTLRYSANVQNRDLISYTRIHAGIEVYPDDSQYWADLGNYSTYLDHKEKMLERRSPEQIWDRDYSWEWDSEDAAQNYRDLYRKKELTLLSSEFIISGFIVNRIASVINVNYLRQKGMQLSAFVSPGAGGGNLHFGLSF